MYIFFYYKIIIINIAYELRECALIRFINFVDTKISLEIEINMQFVFFK